MNKMLYKSGCEWYLNKALCKKLQNTDRNESGEFGVCTFVIGNHYGMDLKGMPLHGSLWRS